jgi:hypothetical protein
MHSDKQLLIGKVLQIKDKINAKRHRIPSDLQSEWDSLDAKTSCLDSDTNAIHEGQSLIKQTGFSASEPELSRILDRLDTLNKEVNVAQIPH